MGLFDRLFGKKKSKAPSPRPIRSDSSPRPITVKGPPGGSNQPYIRSTQPAVTRSPYQQSTFSTKDLDSEAKRILEESIAKISKSRSDVRMRQPAATDKTPATPTAKAPMTPAVGQRPTEAKVKVPKVPISEDKLGEEELFKKLVQMDKELQQKVVTRKVKAPMAPGASVSSATPEIAIPTEKRKPTISEIELRKKERELRKLELKLREKEKKLKEKEDINKMFSQIQDPDLEKITTPPSTEVMPVGVLEGAEFEDLLEPLRNLVFNNFIVGPSNRFAHDVALSVAKAPADAYNPLFIYSSVGLGKTHLLCAIGNYIKSKNPQANVVYVSSERFTNELLDYLRLGEMEKFRTKYRNVDVLLIDDIQFIGGQEGTQEEFFHTFNALYNAHKQIVITSDRPPKNIAHLKDRLRSRFEGGLIVNIKLPDLGTRTMILHEKAEKDGIYIPDEIINYIAAKVKSNVRTLIGVLNRIVAHSSLSDRELDKSLVDDVLRDVVDEGLDITGL